MIFLITLIRILRLVIDEKFRVTTPICAAGIKEKHQYLREISALRARHPRIPKVVFPAKAGIQFTFVKSNS
jgi:hypothetical protein